VTARRAYELGICSQVVDPPARLRAEAQALGEAIAERPLDELRAIKRALWDALEA
jgi:enoyl-CoA hydratase/carnithine racemase